MRFPVTETLLHKVDKYWLNKCNVHPMYNIRFQTPSYPKRFLACVKDIKSLEVASRTPFSTKLEVCNHAKKFLFYRQLEGNNILTRQTKNCNFVFPSIRSLMDLSQTIFIIPFQQSAQRRLKRDTLVDRASFSSFNKCYFWDKPYFQTYSSLLRINKNTTRSCHSFVIQKSPLYCIR